MNSFYSNEELLGIGFKSLGVNILISKKCSIYGASNISIGNNVRIDDFCILSGKIRIGNYVHIGAYSGLFAGEGGIILEDFSAISSKVSLYAVSDDYSGLFMTNPTISSEFRNLIEGKIILRRHSVVGAATVILPGVTLGEGTSIGAMSLVTKNTEPWSINVGIPSTKIKNRSKKILELEENFRRSAQKYE